MAEEVNQDQLREEMASEAVTKPLLLDYLDVFNKLEDLEEKRAELETDTSMSSHRRSQKKTHCQAKIDARNSSLSQLAAELKCHREVVVSTLPQVKALKEVSKRQDQHRWVGEVIYRTDLDEEMRERLQEEFEKRG